MSSEIRPEDIEAAIAAAEQRRRARMGGGGADVATAPAPAARRPLVPERSMASAAATTEASVREAAKPAAASAPMSDDLDDSWLDQPARPRPAVSRVANLPESEVVWEPETGRRSLALPFGIGAVALLVFGSILWWAYSSDTEQAGGEVPVIVADNTPIKEKPAEEGGLEVPDQDKLVYDNIAEGEEGATTVEQLLPAPEEPVTPPQPEPSVAATTGTATTGTAQPAPLPATGEDTDAALADAAPAPAAPVTEPTQTAAAPAPETSSTSAGATAAPAEPAAPAATQEAAAPAAAAPAEPVQPAAGGSWKIQLAAVKSEDGARQEWGRMQRAHPDLLGDMRLTVQRADLGTKGIYYRIQAGPLPDRTTAEDVCSELKASKQPCLVVKP
jgi:cell division septation protein DedD